MVLTSLRTAFGPHQIFLHAQEVAFSLLQDQIQVTAAHSVVMLPRLLPSATASQPFFVFHDLGNFVFFSSCAKARAQAAWRVHRQRGVCTGSVAWAVSAERVLQWHRRRSLFGVPVTTVPNGVRHPAQMLCSHEAATPLPRPQHPAPRAPRSRAPRPSLLAPRKGV